ncbi:uncharacterized protein LOC114869343 isoform X1 [Betta splendens]|uniref:Uncharacterized protein LOC114869343 isoform X1 n=1 Tax=Betta splendens TaxID=158456 RepID=A0A9W2X8I7_BETSP|nr:uncharacterized protein LOC114869343 isoform X1 [Betta splendens]
MFFFYMIITALSTAALTKGAVKCKIEVNETTQHCIAKLDEPLTFQILTHKKKTHLKKSNINILRVNNDKVEDINEDYRSRITQLTNATITLDVVRTTDSGNYLLETFNHEGQLSHTTNFHLEVQAPVSKPNVSQTCLSPEQSVVCCSTEGDGVEFIWSLDNNILIQTRAESTNKPTSEVSNVTISLHGQLTGNLACITQNNISSEQTVIQLRSCKGPICHPPSVTVTAAVVASVCTLLLLLVPFLCIRHLHKTPRPVAVEGKTNTFFPFCYLILLNLNVKDIQYI